MNACHDVQSVSAGVSIRVMGVAVAGLLTKVRKRGVRRKLRSLGMSFGRRLMALYFGTGSRLLMPNTAIAEIAAPPIAQIRSVQASPTLFSRPFKRNGKTKPAEVRYVSDPPLQLGEGAGAELTSDTSTGENDTASEPATLREPLRKEVDDGHVHDAASEADANALQKNQLPHLWTYHGSQHIEKIILK